jgi:hypothetical protein
MRKTVFHALGSIEQVLQASGVDQGSVLFVFRLRYWLVHVVAEFGPVVEQIKRNDRVPSSAQEL